MSSQPQIKSPQAMTAPRFRGEKGKRKLSLLTAYDYPTARLLDQCGIDALLVGDSLATVIYGESNTLSADMDMMLRHTRAVAKAATQALVIADMPFMSYQVSMEQALTNAGRFLKEAGAQAVKLEGGEEMEATIAAITRAGIPVMAHIGLTPQALQAMGGYRTHGKSEEERQYLLRSAEAVQRAGAFAVVLECVVPALADEITARLNIPTVGIGSGNNTDGQILVINDLIGMTLGHVPKFAKPEANIKEQITAAVGRYIQRTIQNTEAVTNATDAPVPPVKHQSQLAQTESKPNEVSPCFSQ
jgi:3-methyl-2-oxobutanoate hydroxymethyltransferase